MIIQASFSEPINEIIRRAGVETKPLSKVDALWTYNGKTILRPQPHRWEQVMKEEFGIEIFYVD